MCARAADGNGGGSARGGRKGANLQRMSYTPSGRVSPASRWVRGRKIILLALLTAGILVVGSALYFSRRATTAVPPLLQLTGLDPAVAQTIETARARVLQTPGSAKAWGRLGMVLYAYHFYDEALASFAQAEILDPTEPRWPYFQGGILYLRDLDAASLKLARATELCAGDPDTPGLVLG